MKTQRRFIRTADTSGTRTPELLSARIPISKIVQAQIKSKIDTFVNWDPHLYLRSRRAEKLTSKQEIQISQQDNLAKALLNFVNEMKRKEKLQKNRRTRSDQVKSAYVNENQRERFKKMHNPLQFIEHYTKTHKFTPNEPQKLLIDKLVQIKALLQSMQTLHLEKVLEEIYELINMVVDFNQLRLLVVVVVLVADICYQAKDFNRAIYYYGQAKTAADYSGLAETVTEALIGMGRVAYDLGLSGASIKFLKKALAYAWQQNDKDSETEIYDILGQNYCLEGKMSQATYYHQRFAQNYTQKQSSAIRKIYIEIIKDDAKGRNLRLYSQNIDLLFLETVSLPVYNFRKMPPQKVSKLFENSIDGESPRKNIVNKNFDYDQFEEAEVQIQAILKRPEFEKQMPNPDVQTLYTPSNRYGKKKREVQFSNTVQFHEITHTKMEISSPAAAKKYSLEKQIKLMLSDKPDPHWYQKMSSNIKRERLQKLGSLKDPVRKSHLKIQQRKRSLSTQSQNIRNSINKAILSWIDPPQ